MDLPKTVVLATTNQGKVREMKQVLSSFGFDVRGLPQDFPEIEETGSTFEENAVCKARTVADALGLPAVADDSGLEVDALNGRPGIFSSRYSDDYPSREGESRDERNNRKLLDELKDVPLERRTARYRCCIAFVFPRRDSFVENISSLSTEDCTSHLDGFVKEAAASTALIRSQRTDVTENVSSTVRENIVCRSHIKDIIVEGSWEGSIACSPRGTGGFGYDPLFLDPDGRTGAELSKEEKMARSHRGQALENLRKKLTQLAEDKSPPKR